MVDVVVAPLGVVVDVVVIGAPVVVVVTLGV
jgi:hypothetical protein